MSIMNKNTLTWLHKNVFNSKLTIYNVVVLGAGRVETLIFLYCPG